jgi:hypothetical protein
LFAVAGCVRAFPRHVADDDRGAHVYAVDPGEPGEPSEGLVVASEAIPAEGLTLLAQWGDDRGRYEATMQRGPELPGGRRVLWDAAGLLVVDAAGAPLRRLRWPTVRADAPIRRVAVDPAGRLVAALDARGTVILGGLDGAGLAPLVVAPRTPATPAVAPGERPEHPSFDYASTEPWRGGEADQRWPSARVAGRLFFSRDGARLVGGESVWDVATRRPLLALREGDGVLAVDADASRAAVASLGGAHRGREPGQPVRVRAHEPHAGGPRGGGA